MDKIQVEVAYATIEEQVILSLEVDKGTTLKDAILQSGILERFKEIDLASNKVGLFGHSESPEKILQEMDRVEIYRPIICDPKEVRRQRAKKKKP